MLIKTLAAITCMIDFFCKSMGASNFCGDRKSALRPMNMIVIVLQKDEEESMDDVLSFNLFVYLQE